MSDRVGEFADVDANVAANVRAYRERAGLSQEELAGRMSAGGFGFTQATIWKLEQGQRALKLSEALALVSALGLSRWDSLTVPPEQARREADLHQANRQAAAAYEAMKKAAGRYIDAQLNLLVAAHGAHEAGVTVSQLFTTWLEIPVVQATVEATVEREREYEQGEQLADDVTRVVQAMRDNGFNPGPYNLDDVEYDGDGRPLPAWTPPT